jgi:hypothetical protein
LTNMSTLPHVASERRPSISLSYEPRRYVVNSSFSVWAIVAGATSKQHRTVADREWTVGLYYVYLNSSHFDCDS